MPRAILPSLLLAACSSGSYLGADAMTDASSDAPSSSWSGDDDDGGTSTTAPPEVEEDRLLLPPAQTDVFVFVPNPERDTVTRINVRSLAVDTTMVGTDPQIVLTTPDFGTAVVFNRGDDTVTLLDADTLEQDNVDVRANMNDMVLSPDGGWAILWHNVARERPDDPKVEGLQSFNEVDFVDVRRGTHQPLAVGFNPRMVRFTPDGSLAVVVSDAYLSIVDLTVDPLSPSLVELEPGVLDPASAEEVIVAPDGSFAWVRQFGSSALRVVDLASGAVGQVPAGDNPTDLDLSPDGRAAVAVARGSAELWVYDAARPFVAPQVVALPPDGAYGQLLFDPTGRQGVLYTTASAIERFAVWDPVGGTVTERSLVKPVQSVAVSPTGGTMLVFHTKTDGPATEPVFAGHWAMSLVDLSDFRSNPLLLPAEPLGYANSTSGHLGYMVMDGQQYFEVLNYDTLLHDQYSLRSPPVFLGVLPDLSPEDGEEPPAWISQEYPLGRISFFDSDDGSLDTLTGFELNSEIEVE
ncbi:MAG: YncE family protein [Myxococcales bacterium]|nr:YncE family protein [Myxococcales bacterium]